MALVDLTRVSGKERGRQALQSQRPALVGAKDCSPAVARHLERCCAGEIGSHDRQIMSEGQLDVRPIELPAPTRSPARTGHQEVDIARSLAPRAIEIGLAVLIELLKRDRRTLPGIDHLLQDREPQRMLLAVVVNLAKQDEARVPRALADRLDAGDRLSRERRATQEHKT